jgi:SAM-dependent methyltransferase
MSDVDPISRVFRDLSLEFFLEHIPSASRVLDCGCGDGAVTIPLAQKGCEVDALDRDQDRLDNVKRLAVGLAVHTHCVDILSAPFQDQTFDYVISRQFLPHFANWRDILKFQARLTKMGGAVILHHRCEDNAVLCEGLAPTKSIRAVVRRGYTNRYTASISDLRQFCVQAGCVLEKLVPISFFTPRAALWRISMRKEEREAYRIELERRLSSPEVYDFVSWFESTVTAKAPPALSDGFLAVLRRRHTPPTSILRRLILMVGRGW